MSQAAYLQSDPEAFGSYVTQVASGGAAVDPAFQSDFITALWQHQVDVALMDPTELDNLMTAAWNDPFLQNEFQSGVITSMTGAIGRQLFGSSATTKSSNPSLLSMGLSILAGQGIPLTATQQQSLGLGTTIGALSAAERTPYMFDPAYFNSQGGYVFGQQVPTEINGMPGYASGIHEGTDYELPMNTPIYAPVAGTVHVTPGAVGYGNELELRLANGWTIRLGHLNTFGVVDGQVVNPGDLLATSGSTGTSLGPHLLMEWRDPSGQAHDPNELLNPIFAGETLGATASRLSDPTAAGTGLSYDAHLDAQFTGAAGAWRKYFGRNPTAQELASIIAAGGPNQDLKSMEDYVRSLPSHIGGIAVGAYTDLRNSADAISYKILGHNATDQIVKELYDGNHLTDQAITNWYNFHGVSGNVANGTGTVGGMSAATYNAIYAANKPTMDGVYNTPTGFDPRIAIAQAAAAGQQVADLEATPSPTQQTQTAESLGADFALAAVTDPPPPPNGREGAKPLMDQ